MQVVYCWLSFWVFIVCKNKKIDNDISLNQFHGYVYEQNTTGFLFLVSAMGMLGFPLTAAFIGIDVMFTYVHSNQLALIILLALCLIFIELSAFRILLRIFLARIKIKSSCGIQEFLIVRMKNFAVSFLLVLTICSHAQNDRVNDFNNTNWLQTFNTIPLNKNGACMRNTNGEGKRD